MMYLEEVTDRTGSIRRLIEIRPDSLREEETDVSARGDGFPDKGRRDLQLGGIDYLHMGVRRDAVERIALSGINQERILGKDLLGCLPMVEPEPIIRPDDQVEPAARIGSRQRPERIYRVRGLGEAKLDIARAETGIRTDRRLHHFEPTGIRHEVGVYFPRILWRHHEP